MNQTIHAILIEDDAQMCEILGAYLWDYDIAIKAFQTPSKGLKALQESRFDIAILDINLPEMEGLEVCRIIKAQSNIPVIITSARSAISDRVIGLELGADDYLPKPFDPRELVARIRVAVRKQNKEEITGLFELNQEAMEVFMHGKKLSLTRGEFEVFALLLSKPNVVLSRDYIVEHAESLAWESIGKSVDTIVGRIRTKIGDSARNPRYIQAIRGVGYRFIP